MHPMMDCHDPSNENSFHLAHRLWRDFFSNEAYLKLKICQRCSTWFVDCSRNRRGEFCTTKCGRSVVDSRSEAGGQRNHEGTN